MKLRTYDEIINYIIEKKRVPHLLMGNGFSISYDNKIFSYNALYKFIEEIDDELLSKLFEIIKTKNFESVMQQLNNFCEFIKVFDPKSELLQKVQFTNNNLKQSLMKAIKALHPEHVFSVPEHERKNCAEFFSKYLSHDGNVFTTNYDILMYWVLASFGKEMKFNYADGFGREVEDEDEGELIWGKYKDSQNVHYLHGALPLFDKGIDITKAEYKSGICLLDNIEKRISNGQYPIFVASGNGEEKLRHIMHNKYLTYCYEKLTNIEGSLVTFGFNFGEYDYHIIEAINKAAKHGAKTPNKLCSIFIGIYSDDDLSHIESIKDKFKCKVNYFDAKTVKVWR